MIKFSLQRWRNLNFFVFSLKMYGFSPRSQIHTVSLVPHIKNKNWKKAFKNFAQNWIFLAHYCMQCSEPGGYLNNITKFRFSGQSSLWLLSTPNQPHVFISSWLKRPAVKDFVWMIRRKLIKRFRIGKTLTEKICLIIFCFIKTLVEIGRKRYVL